jgi:hypothetical protein
MIVVKVDLHSAITGKRSELARAHIYNDGTSDKPTRGHYEARFLRRGSARIQRMVRVENHPRLSAPVWTLLRKALEAAGY